MIVGGIQKFFRCCIELPSNPRLFGISERLKNDLIPAKPNGCQTTIISFAVKLCRLGQRGKAAMPKVLDCGKAQFNTFMVSLKRYESRVEIG